jgi:L-amino acid N-acyltransferase YncA
VTTSLRRIAADGGTYGQGDVRIRTAGPADVDAITVLVDQLVSEGSRTRYHVAGLAPVQEQVRAAVPLGRHVVAVAAEGASERVVGIASWEPEPPGDISPRTAAATLAVADGWRLGDVGRRLIAEIASRAVGQGIECFTAEIEPRNAALRAAARALGLSEHREGTVVEIDLRPFAGLA